MSRLERNIGLLRSLCAIVFLGGIMIGSYLAAVGEDQINKQPVVTSQPAKHPRDK